MGAGVSAPSTSTIPPPPPPTPSFSFRGSIDNDYVNSSTPGGGSTPGENTPSTTSADGSSAPLTPGQITTPASTPNIPMTPAVTSAAAAANRNNDPLLSHITRDLPHHRVESRLIPGSGRMMRSYRIRSDEKVNGGASLVVRIMLVRFESPNVSTNPLALNISNTQTSAAAADGGGSNTSGGAGGGNTQNRSSTSGIPTEEELQKELSHHTAELKRIRTLVSSSPHTHPNILPHLKWFQSQLKPIRESPRSTTFIKPLYVLRPYMYTTLSDRIASRPFLTFIEKSWIAYQILSALHTCHESNVVHGHLTADNIALTSWNWVMVTDIASYQPVKIPDHDPSLFIRWFQERQDEFKSGGGMDGGGVGDGGDSFGGGGDGSKRTAGGGALMRGEKRCYLAPERFYSQSFGSGNETKKKKKMESKDDDGDIEDDEITKGKQQQKQKDTDKEEKLTPAMDIFSVGCVLMELFLNGEGALDLGDLMEYRRSNTMVPSLIQKLNKIESSSMRAACRHMLNLDPDKRLTAMEYIERLSTSPPPVRKDGKAVSSGGGSSTVRSAPIPPCFSSVLFPIMKRIRCEVLSPDARIALVARHYGWILKETVGIKDSWGERYFARVIGPTLNKFEEKYTNSEEKTDKLVGSDPSSEHETKQPVEQTTSAANKSRDVGDDSLLAETEALLRQLDEGGFLEEDEQVDGVNMPHITNQSTSQLNPPILKDNFLRHRHIDKSTMSPSAASLIILLQLVLSSLRHVQRPSSKLLSLQLLRRLSLFSTDETLLQRIVPSLVSLLHDTDASVRASAISALAEILSTIKTFPPSDAKLFPQYIFKSISHLVSDPCLMVRVAFAESIGLLAETALRFLDMSYAVHMYDLVESGGDGVEETSSFKEPKDTSKTAVPDFSDDLAKLLDEKDGSSTHTDERVLSTATSNVSCDSSPTTNIEPTAGTTSNILIDNSSYEADLTSLQGTISGWVMQIATDSSSEYSSKTKLALLQNLERICNFFGHDGVMLCILPQVYTFLNDRQDWQLRATLCEHLPSICAVVGRAATEQFVVPCVETALVDIGEDMVMCRGLDCLAKLVEMGLITRSMLFGRHSGSKLGDDSGKSRPDDKSSGIIQKYSPLLIYPSADVRHAASSLISAACRSVGFPDDEVFVVPLIRPYLCFQPNRNHLETLEGIESCLVRPFTKHKLDFELEKLSDQRRKNDPASPQWTSIEAQKDTNDVPSDIFFGVKRVEQKVLSEKDAKEGANGISENKEEEDVSPHMEIPRVENMKAYLRLLVNNRKYLRDDACKTLWSSARLDGTIDGSLKLAHTCMVPNQKYVELITPKFLPDWYDTLRHVSSENGDISLEESALQLTSLVSQVYGLTVSQPSTSIQPLMKLQDSVEVLGEAFSWLAEGQMSNESAKDFLSGDETKLFESSQTGEWGSLAVLDSALIENSLLVSKLISLRVPPLPPRLGVLREADGRVFSFHGQLASTNDTSNENEFSFEWRPKPDSPVASSSPACEHTGPVTRLAVSQDQAFFVSASHDGTSRVWELRQVQESAGDLRSCLTYDGHCSAGNGKTTNVRINDAAIVENSHSVATGASDGAVHVWRVDMVMSTSRKSVISSTGTIDRPAVSSSRYYENARVSGSSLVRQVDPKEGEVMAVSHFNTPSASIVAFATQKGVIHSWDLRSAVEPFSLSIRPELGYLTSMAVGDDRNWLVAGTNRGYLALWDVRFQMMVKLWQHSSSAPVSRLATSFTQLPANKDAPDSSIGDARPLIFMGCGPNEASVFDVSNGSCRQCFRVLDPELSYVDQSSLPLSCSTLPTLEDVKIPSSSRERLLSTGSAISGIVSERLTPPEPSIYAMSGRVGRSGPNYLITGGSDRAIRYWSFSDVSKCYNVSGLATSQPRPTYESVYTGGNSRLYLCRPMPLPKTGEVESSKIPRKLQRGAIRPENQHRDSILDLKKVDFPMNGLLSCSRDGVIKMWR